MVQFLPRNSVEHVSAITCAVSAPLKADWHTFASFPFTKTVLDLKRTVRLSPRHPKGLNRVATHDGAYESDGGEWDGIEFILVSGSRAPLTIEKRLLKSTQHCLTFKAAASGYSILKVNHALRIVSLRTE